MRELVSPGIRLLSGAKERMKERAWGCNPEPGLLRILSRDGQRLTAGVKNRAVAGEKLFTVVRLGDGASLERACELSGVSVTEVDFTQSMGEKIAPEKLMGDFRVISFDGHQITISERIAGERRVRGFAVDLPLRGVSESPPSSRETAG
jgi:hypothetical protein